MIRLAYCVQGLDQLVHLMGLVAVGRATRLTTIHKVTSLSESIFNINNHQDYCTSVGLRMTD